jgi:hypothetical protein
MEHPEDSHADATKGSGIKLAGATMVARVGSGATPAPRPLPAAPPQEQMGTQVAAPRTVVAEAAVPASTVAVPAPAAAKKRPGWAIPAAVVAVLAVVGVGAAAMLGGAGGGTPPPTPTTEAAAVVASATEAPTNTPTTVPLTTQLQELKKETELRDKAGSEASSRVEGLLPAGSQFFVKRAQWIHWVMRRRRRLGLN